jgi:hypothetical protein
MALDGRDRRLPVRVMVVGRLDNIIARNRRPARLQERVIVSMLMGAIVLLVILLAVFTDLGLPPDAAEIRRAHQPAAAPSSPAATDPRPASPADPQGAPASGHTRRVNGILLRTPPAKPASH